MYSCVLSKPWVTIISYVFLCFVQTLGYNYFFQQSPCLCYSLSNCVLLFFSYDSPQLLLFFTCLLLQWSNFHYRITELEGLGYYTVFFKVFCGLNLLLIMPVKYLLAQNTKCFLLKSSELKERKLFSTPQRLCLCQRRRKSCYSESYEGIQESGNTGPHTF
jgi:hypothetical protein